MVCDDATATCSILPQGGGGGGGGAFPSLRYNEVRDLTANQMAEVCHNVSIEPHLQPLSGEDLHDASANTKASATLDVAVGGFWGGRFDRAFLM